MLFGIYFYNPLFAKQNQRLSRLAAKVWSDVSYLVSQTSASLKQGKKTGWTVEEMRLSPQALVLKGEEEG